MTKITASVYFLGEYRPAYFEASTVDAAICMAEDAIRNVAASDREWLQVRLTEARKQIKSPSCAAWSADRGYHGVSIAKRPHDPFLDAVTAKLPPCPGLDYSNAVNR